MSFAHLPTTLIGFSQQVTMLAIPTLPPTTLLYSPEYSHISNRAAFYRTDSRYRRPHGAQWAVPAPPPAHTPHWLCSRSNYITQQRASGIWREEANGRKEGNDSLENHPGLVISCARVKWMNKFIKQQQPHTHKHSRTLSNQKLTRDNSIGQLTRNWINKLALGCPGTTAERTKKTSTDYYTSLGQQIFLSLLLGSSTYLGN